MKTLEKIFSKVYEEEFKGDDFAESSLKDNVYYTQNN